MCSSDLGTAVAILSLGTRLADSLKAAGDLAALGLSATVADARFAKPLDTDLISRLAREHAALLVVEESSIGGFTSLVLDHLARTGMLETGLKVRALHLPDRFIAHDAPTVQMADAGLHAAAIVAAAVDALGVQKRAEGLRGTARA